MSGESAQDIEVSITAPNRSFHATVIASDVSWQDRPGGTIIPEQSQQPRRPIWSSAFGESTDLESESLDPMINSATSLSQDSLDGFAVEFISSKENLYMNGDVSTGLSSGDVAVEAAAAAAAAANPAAAAAAAAFTAVPTAASDAVSTSIEMRPVGFAETDRGSISCEMITPKPVLAGNGHVSTGETTVSSSSRTTVTETTVTSGTGADATTVTSSSTTVTDFTGAEPITVTSSSTTVTGPTVTDSTVTSSSTTVTGSDDAAVTTHAPVAPGSTFQMSYTDHDEHAEAPERPRDRAMSLHERSMLAHDIHSLASTMDTIKDEDEEIPVGISMGDEKRSEERRDSFIGDRRVSLTGVPVSATTYIAPSQPTIFEAAESAAAAIAAAAEAAAPAAAATAADASAAPAADEPSPYLRKLLDAQEATRQLMALLGESTQMLGTLPTNKPDEKEKEPAADAAAAASATSAAAAETTASSTSFSSTYSSSMSSSSAFSSSTGAATTTESSASATDTTQATTQAADAAPETQSATNSVASAASDVTVVPQSPAAVPESPAYEILSRPIDITFDDGSVVPPTAAPPAAADTAATEIPVSVWKPEVEGSAAPAAPAFGAAAPAGAETQNASICNALESIAANMTTVTTTSMESSSNSSSTVTTTAPISLSAPVLIEPTASPKISICEDSSAAPAADAAPTPTVASLLHESTVAGLSVDLPTPRLTPEPDQERFLTNNAESEATIRKSSFTLDSSTTSSTTEISGVAATATDYVEPTTSVVLQAEPSTPAAAAPAAETAPPSSTSSSTVTTTAPVSLGVPVLIEPTVSPKISICEDTSAAPAADTADVAPTSIVASLLHETTVAGLSVDLPTPRLTPEPDQERFLTNNAESEATIRKSSFTLETSTSSTTETGAATATDYVEPTTSVVLQAEPSTPAATPAAESAPTLTPAAVDVPVEIVRHLDDASAWHTASDATEADGKAVPIAVVPAGGPPPLAREPPLPEVNPVEEPKPADQGPPPLARESEHHEFSRSVMVERRVLSPDSAAHAEHAAAAAAPHETQQQLTSSSSGTQDSKPVDSTPATATQQSEPAAAASDAPLSVVLQPADSQQDKASDASIDIPVTVQQDKPAEPTQDTPATPATDSVPIPVWIQQDSTTEKAADTVIPVTVVQQESSTESSTTSTDIPVTVWKQPEQETAASAATTTEAAAPASAATEIPVTITQESSTTELSKQAESAESAAPAAETQAAASEIPVSIVQQETEKKTEGSTEIPVTIVENTTDLKATESVSVDQDKSETSAAASVDIPVSISSVSEAAAPTVEQPVPVAADAASAASEVPVASAAAQEQEKAAAAPAVDSGATPTSPTTAHAPMSLESTFQITPSEVPSEDDAAHPPTMPRDRAMSIHERSLLAHEPSGFIPGLEPVAENENGEVHVANAAESERARRASLVPGADGVAASTAFQLPSTSCLFTVDEATPRDEDEQTTAPASTASPSNESETTIASSIIDVTAPQDAAAAKPPAESGGVKWMTENEPSDSAQTVVTPAPAADAAQLVVSDAAAAPAAPAADAPPATPKTPTSGVSLVNESAKESTEGAAAPVDDVAKTDAAATPAAPAADAPPQTPKTPTGVSWVTEPSIQDSTANAAAPVGGSAQTAPAVDAPPQTPKTPSGVSWITEPSTDAAAATAAPAAPAATEPIAQQQSVAPTESVQQQQPTSEAPPQTPKSPSAGMTWVAEPAANAASTTQAAATTEQPPATPKSPSGGVSWITEPSQAAADSQPPSQTPKTPTGVSWITEPAAGAAPTASDVTSTSTPSTEAPPQTPKTPTGVSWITEPAAAAAPSTPSVINITAPLATGDAPRSPKSPTSPGIKWASETTRTGGNASDAGGAPAPQESTFVVNAPWEGADRAPQAPEPSKPDDDGVTWITEAPVAPAVTKEPESAQPRPPLTRSESTRSERDPSTATDITVREATPQRRPIAPGISGDEENLTNGVTQEALGTKVRKLSWADQQQSGAEDSFSAAIDDYEKKLNETTAQTKELVDLLCQTGNQITENSMKMSDVFSDAVQAGVRSMLDQERRDRASAVLSPIAENGEPMSREAPPQLIAGALPPNVESVIISCPELTYVTGSLVLENANILVTDDEAGLFLFTLDSKVVRHVTNPAWKHAASPCIFKDRLKSYILILMDCKDEEDGSWVRHIVKFTENLDFMEKVECPKWIRERTIISDRLAVNRYENIYYCANGEIFSGLYELAPTGKWTELLYRQSESFVDMLAFAIIGPIQQILVVEGRRDHVLLCSIRESVCVEARRMAICERPGALARDESGRLFVMNRAQAAVQIVDTRVWAACRNMALVDKFVPHFSASFGMLVIPQKKAVKVHKYAFEWDD